MSIFKEEMETKVDRVQKIQGPKGDRGIQGEQGLRGSTGIQGKDGINGHNGKDFIGQAKMEDCLGKIIIVTNRYPVGPLNELVNANFAYNNFEYPLDDDIKAMCIRKPMYGLIPSVNFPSLQTEATCTGFGGKYAISRFIPSAGCIICNKDPNLNTMVVISFLVFSCLSFLFIRWYKRSSERFPDKVKQTAASMSILSITD